MPDDKRGREEQARHADRRQRQREVEAALERGDEPEPPIEETSLDDLERALDEVSFPATGAEVVAAVGDRTVESTAWIYPAADLVPETEAESFETPADVRRRVRRPSVAAAMKRVLDAIEDDPTVTLDGSQRDAYEKTFRELAAIDAVDDDEGVAVVADWVVDRIDEEGTLPGSREIRRQAADVCRGQGYEVRSDEWLGV